MTTLSVTRRRCVLRLGCFTGGLLGATLPLKAAASRNPIAFTVVTDTHVGRRDNDGALSQWKRTAAEIAKAPGAFVLHLGDVVDGGRAEQYPAYKKVRDGIGSPVHEIPGNHDPVDGFAKQLRKQVDTTVDHQWLRCVLMNNSHRDSHDGFFTDDQINWLAKRCEEAAADDRLVLVGCHVPVHDNRHPDRGWYVKHKDGQKAFYEILVRYRDSVVGLFHGHFHNGLRGWDDRAPLHEICFPSSLYNQNRGLEAKSAPGYNPDEFRPGYSRVEIGHGKLTITYHPTEGEPTVRKSLRSL